MVSTCPVLSSIRLSTAGTDSDLSLNGAVVAAAAVIPLSCHESAHCTCPGWIARNFRSTKRCAREVSHEVVSMSARLCRSRLDSSVVFDYLCRFHAKFRGLCRIQSLFGKLCHKKYLDKMLAIL